ncbi:u4/U6 small nuclear ribonucleoprotein Prp31 [Syncephalis plumigaleata]|nr:u4/U6 small nuclear ribonucleoprotein Prp31 [Syncephalis plumigaleata]
MSLADELLADLDDLGNDLEDEVGLDDATAANGNSTARMEEGTGFGEDVDMEGQESTLDAMDMVAITKQEEEETERRINELVANAKSIRDVAKLLSTKTMTGILQRIEEFTQEQATAEHFAGPVESHPEYATIVQTNNLTADVDNEILAVHKFIRDHYAARFPELESLVLNPYDYVQTVKAMDLGQLKLDDVLPSATIMVVTMAGSTTRGRRMELVDDACNMALSLDAAREKMLNYLIAPNLSAIVGTSTAAKMMGAAGGKMPACNVQVLGASAKARTGFSNIGMQRHAGFIYYSNLISRVPSDLRSKATRIVAAKCTLAARIDRCQKTSKGESGQAMLEEIRKRIEKLQEPPPNKNTRALPAPIESSKKKRGGRRVRKQKEAYEMTELRRQQNRVHFSGVEDESYTMDETKGLGMMTKQIGRIRAAAAETRNKATVSNAMQRRLKAYGSGSSGATSGLASSLAFTPVQGIELENPEARAQKMAQLTSRYFDAAQGFLQVKEKRKRDTMDKEDAAIDKASGA